MSIAALDRLIDAEQALIAALDGDGEDALAAALAGFPTAISGMKAAGGWRDLPDIEARLTHALRLAEAARIRTAYLADRTRRQIERLASIGARPMPALGYGRNGAPRG